MGLLAAVLVAASGLQIHWQAPEACPQGEELRARVGSLVGAAAQRTDLVVTGRVVRAGETWSLALGLVRQGSGETRALQDRDCRGLVEAAAVVIAVAIDPRASGLEGGEVVPAPPEIDDRGDVPGDRSVVPAPPVKDVPGDRSVGTRPEIEDVPGDRVEGPSINKDVPRDRAVGAEVEDVPGDRSVEPVLKDRGRLALSFKIGGGVGFARVLPRVHGVIDLGAALGGRGWRVEASGLFAPPVRGSSAVAGIGGVFRLGAGEVRGCGVPAVLRGALGFPLCAGVQLGAIHGRGEGDGLEVQQAARSLWAALRVGPALRYRPRGGRVGLWLGADVVVALTRPLFRTAGGVTVHEAARLGGQASVGVEVWLR